MPGRAGRRRLQGEPEEDRRVERVHGRPALGAVAQVAGHAGLPGDAGEQAGEPALALVVHRTRQAYGRAADPALGQVQDRRDRATATADRSFGHRGVGLGGGAARREGRARGGDEGAVAADELLPEGREGGALLGDRLHEGVGAAEVVGEGQVDHAVGLGGAGAQDVQIGETSAQRLGAGLLGGPRRGVGAGEGEDGVAVAEQLGDDGGADQAGAAGDEDAHGTTPTSDETFVPSL